MSRPLLSSQRPLPHRPTNDNPYQATTLATLPISHSYNRCTKDFQNVYSYNDTGVSDGTCSETNTYYDYHHYLHTCKTDHAFSDDSDVVRLPYYEHNEISVKRFSKNNFQDFQKKAVHQKVYPKHRGASDAAPPRVVLPLRVPTSQISDRPQSSLSSGITSAVVDGCGGHCQTFENICYYFLQVAFTMGILIGTSLAIAGAVLRKSAARNLQVLVYIGALLSMVSALLLAIQCSARYNARNRKKALRNAKRAPIPLDTLHARPAVLQQQPLIGDHLQRAPTLQVPVAHVQPQKYAPNEHQGIPWWRRKDLD